MLVFAGWQTAATLSRAPAFNRSLQVEAATGGTVTRYALGMYDRADYYYRMALGWYFQFTEDTTSEEDGSTSTEETNREHAKRVLDIAKDSLRNSPGDPTSWMLIAKVEMALGNREAALQAFRVSNDLAPHDAVLAMNRLYFLTSFVSDPAGRDLAIATIAPGAVQTNLEAIRRTPSMSRSLQRFIASPALAAFLDNRTVGD